GQFQKRLAAAEAGERLTNVRERLGDIRRMWDDPQISIDDVAQYFKIEDRRRAIRIELRRLRREAGAERRGRRGRRNTRAMGSAGRIAHRLEIEAKGLFAARVYGENTILVAEAVWLGWFEGLTPEELCAVVVMLAAEDRERRGDRQAHGPRRYPTPAIAQTARLVRSLYFRFADMERDLNEPNLRSPSHDYIDFAYRWSSGEA